MQTYRCDKMTDQQKARYKEVNRKTAAAYSLKKKLNEDAKKSDRNRQQKCRLLKQIPKSPSNFKRMV